MNKKNKGFTLIELLAIIVILAIIAVITVPIILNVIDNAKRGTAKDSAYGYKDAISKYYVTEMLEENAVTLNGTYTVDSNGVLTKDIEKHEIMFSGTKPKGGYLTYTNNVLTIGCLTIDDYKIVFENGEATNVESGECGNANENLTNPDDLNNPTNPDDSNNPTNPDDSNNPTNPDTPTEPETPQLTYKCKRAELSTLHQEECTQTSGSCYDAGYIEDNKGTTITYGNKEVIKGTLTSGDAFDCDVNGDGEYNPQTERFYYVSDLYNTTTKQFDSNYAVLIYYNNFANGYPDNTSSSLVAYNLDDKNYNGPITAKTYLPLTSIWTNITLSNTTRAILNHNGEGTTNNEYYNLPTEFSYEGYAARLLTVQEINSACDITVGPRTVGELDSCYYLMENTKYSNSSLGTSGYWTESPSSENSNGVWYVLGSGRKVNSSLASYSSYFGSRPAIEVLKTDIEY